MGGIDFVEGGRHLWLLTRTFAGHVTGVYTPCVYTNERALRNFKEWRQPRAVRWYLVGEFVNVAFSTATGLCSNNAFRDVHRWAPTGLVLCAEVVGQKYLRQTR